MWGSRFGSVTNSYSSLMKRMWSSLLNRRPYSFRKLRVEARRGSGVGAGDTCDCQWEDDLLPLPAADPYPVYTQRQWPTFSTWTHLSECESMPSGRMLKLYLKLRWRTWWTRALWSICVVSSLNSVDIWHLAQMCSSAKDSWRSHCGYLNFKCKMYYWKWTTMGPCFRKYMSGSQWWETKTKVVPWTTHMMRYDDDTMGNNYFVHKWINKLFSEGYQVPVWRCLTLVRRQGLPHTGKLNSMNLSFQVSLLIQFIQSVKIFLFWLKRLHQNYIDHL